MSGCVFRVWAIVSATLSTIAFAQAETTEIHFPRGPGTTVEGTITGATIATYQVEVPAGAKMSVWLESDNLINHFTVAEANESAPLHDSSAYSAGISYETRVEGQYIVSVFLLPERSTSASIANYELTFYFQSLPDATSVQRIRLKSTIPLEVEWMSNFCKAEANALFSTHGPSVMTLPPIPMGSRLIVQGFSRGPSEDIRFQCWFGQDGVYQAITRDQ